jgi:hypothetical protein
MADTNEGKGLPPMLYRALPEIEDRPPLIITPEVDLLVGVVLVLKRSSYPEQWQSLVPLAIQLARTQMSIFVIGSRFNYARGRWITQHSSSQNRCKVWHYSSIDFAPILERLLSLLC